MCRWESQEEGNAHNLLPSITNTHGKLYTTAFPSFDCFRVADGPRGGGWGGFFASVPMFTRRRILICHFLKPPLHIGINLI